jgi:hypothetical protein
MRAACLWFALCACLSIHFYGIIDVAVIGLAEIFWSISRKKLRSAIWVALVGAGLFELALYPLAAHLKTFLSIDTGSSNYYGRPSFRGFAMAIVGEMFGGVIGLFVGLVGLLVFAVTFLLRRRTTNTDISKEFRAPRGCSAAQNRFHIALLALMLLPVLGFGLSFFVTKSFSPRYISSVALLTGLGTAYLLNQASARRVIAVALMPLLAVTLVVRSKAFDPVRDAVQSLKLTRPDVPIVIGEGLLFIELLDAAPENMRSRLVYLLTPPGTANPDTTNESQVKRLKFIFPDIRVTTQGEFLASHRAFDLISRRNFTTDVTTSSLISRGVLSRPWVQSERVQVYRYNGDVR